MTEILRNPGQAAWDAYAGNNGGATFSHRYAWGQSLSAAYQLPIFRLAARHRPGDREFTGILALMLFAAPNRELRLISLPYTDAAGIVADDPANGTALFAAALELAVEPTWFISNCARPALRFFKARPQNQPSAGVISPIPSRPVSAALCPNHPTSSGPSFRAKVRNQVRKARTCGCTVAVGGPERVDDFYAVFSENMRDLGSPVHEPGLFPNVALSNNRLVPRWSWSILRQGPLPPPSFLPTCHPLQSLGLFPAPLPPVVPEYAVYTGPCLSWP